ncbi:MULTISPECIES: alpha/beta hydrolase [Anaerolinea]|uniref:alpha/beta hydrolase n=1 Tax=Anaerolinea TaxID=233189 RepID=UPI0026263BF3|nr:alpha/beta fold hydrolase [Anaerolinea thermophila]
MNIWRRALWVVFIALVVPALVLPVQAQAPAPGGEQVPRFESGDCPMPVPPGMVAGTDLTCGWLIVPERYEDPQGNTLRLAVVIFHPTGTPEPDPIVFAQGGPGGSTIDYYTQVLPESPLREHFTLILFDQRGTLYSQPFLFCEEIFQEGIDLLPVDVTAEESEKRYYESAMACRERLTREGVNLSAYNSVENAHDVNALREALGYEKIHFYGVSYGTLLAQHLMREHPEALRSVILDAVVPLQGNFNLEAPFSQDRAFNEFFNACASDPECQQGYPDLEKRFFDLVERLEKQPVTIILKDDQSMQSYPALLDGDSMISLLFQTLYATELLPILPAMIRETEQGHYGLVERIFSILVFDRTMAYGMYHSVVCSEDGRADLNRYDYSRIRPELRKDVDVSNRAFLKLCQDWGVSPLGSEAEEPVSSDIPTLIFNGRFDPITPPEYGEMVAKYLRRVYSFTFPNTGHGAFSSNDCANQIMLEFVKDPDREPDASCLANQRMDFVTPREYISLPVISNLLNLDQRLLLPALILGTAAVFLLTLWVVYPLGWLIRRLRSIPAGVAPLSHYLATASGLMSGALLWLFLAGLVVALGVLVSNNNPLILLGMPDTARPIFLIPLLMLGVSLALVGFIPVAWRRWRWWTRGYFVLLAISALAALGVLAWWGMLFAGI